MVPEATLDVPSATTTSNAEPQQGASTARTTPAPTAASDMLPGHSQESPGSYSAATDQATDRDIENPTRATAAMKSQTSDHPAVMQSDSPPDTAGNPMPNDAGSDASPTTDGSPDAGSDASSTATGSPTANDARTSTSHTAMMESQTPEMVSGSQGDSSSTTASSSLANGASTDTQSDSSGASPSSTSVGISPVSDVCSHATLALFLLLSYIVW